MTLVACEVRRGNAVTPVAEYCADKDESGGVSMLCVSSYVRPTMNVFVVPLRTSVTSAVDS